MASIYETFEFGYDPTVPEHVELATPSIPATLPPSAQVNRTYLPPVGKQMMPNCFVWSTTYGLITYWAAQNRNAPPASPADIASPDYTYIQVEVSTSAYCSGGKFVPVFQWIKQNRGTPSLAAAPNLAGSSSGPETCEVNWAAYGPGSKTIPPDTSFEIPGYVGISIAGAEGLNAMRAMIAAGVPLAYGSRLYTDFSTYSGIPSPYVGNGQLLYKKNDPTQLVGHCMMIIGYDDTFNAVLIQNSFGHGWGGGGYVWMAYVTFQTLAQGSAFYIPAPTAG